MLRHPVHDTHGPQHSASDSNSVRKKTKKKNKKKSTASNSITPSSSTNSVQQHCEDVSENATVSSEAVVSPAAEGAMQMSLPRPGSTTTTLESITGHEIAVEKAKNRRLNMDAAISVMLDDTTSVESCPTKLRTRIKRLQADLQVMTDENASLKLDIISFHRRFCDMEQKFGVVENLMNTYRDAVNKKDAEIKRTKSSLEVAGAERNELTEVLKAKETELDELCDVKAKLKDQVDALERVDVENKRHLSEFKSKTSDLEAQINVLKSEREKQKEACLAHEEEKSRSESEIRQLEQRNLQQQKENEGLKSDLLKYQVDLSLKEEELKVENVFEALVIRCLCAPLKSLFDVPLIVHLDVKMVEEELQDMALQRTQEYETETELESVKGRLVELERELVEQKESDQKKDMMIANLRAEIEYLRENQTWTVEIREEGAVECAPEHCQGSDPANVIGNNGVSKTTTAKDTVGHCAADVEPTPPTPSTSDESTTASSTKQQPGPSSSRMLLEKAEAAIQTDVEVSSKRDLERQYDRRARFLFGNIVWASYLLGFFAIVDIIKDFGRDIADLRSAYVELRKQQEVLSERVEGQKMLGDNLNRMLDQTDRVSLIKSQTYERLLGEMSMDCAKLRLQLQTAHQEIEQHKTTIHQHQFTIANGETQFRELMSQLGTKDQMLATAESFNKHLQRTIQGLEEQLAQLRINATNRDAQLASQNELLEQLQTSLKTQYDNPFTTAWIKYLHGAEGSIDEQQSADNDDSAMLSPQRTGTKRPPRTSSNTQFTVHPTPPPELDKMSDNVAHALAGKDCEDWRNRQGCF
ncbi:hypothetical protein HK102_002086 [Quaeritorhiza haematococci]|nr:hypothetical protein HK102_002086 [Quaeritorhiza haematococci]